MPFWPASLLRCARPSVSLSTVSTWSATAVKRSLPYQQLQGDLASTFDVCVVGGGIVGVATAYTLAKAGLTVALLEARTMGMATTGWSTAKLTAQQNLIYSALAAEHGKETAKKYAEMQMAAIAMVEAQDRELGLNCGFKRGEMNRRDGHSAAAVASAVGSKPARMQHVCAL